MFGVAPEEEAVERLRRRDGWQPPEPETLAYGDEGDDDDPRWEDLVARWEQDDYPVIREPEGEDDE